jgi:hypothetical protein
MNQTFYIILDIDKNGYIDQSEIDIMAKVIYLEIRFILIYFLCSM